MREFELLEHIYAANARLNGAIVIPPGDDMGMVRLRSAGSEGNRAVLAAVDQLVDGRHVRVATTPLELVGRKAITRSLSDIAAMAARPLASLAAAVLPRDFGQERANILFDAMRATAEQYGCPLIGGDIAVHETAGQPLVCAVTVLAEPGPVAPITRRGARAGDGVYVTGALGGSLQDDGLGRHLTFEPRISEALELAALLGERLHAMLDISDGLGRDVSHIAHMSGVCIELNASQLPLNAGCDWRQGLTDGEDYELCFTASGTVPDRVGAVPITRVGSVMDRSRSSHGEMTVVRLENGHTIPAGELGWQHTS